MRSIAVVSLIMMIGCGEPVVLSPIPDEPDAGRGAGSPDLGVIPPQMDAGVAPFDAGPQPECIPSQHIPTPCMAAGCYGAVLCLGDRLQCVVPDCRPPEPGECGAVVDYVFIVDRSASMAPFMAHVQAITSSLTADATRAYYFVDVPGRASAADLPAPNRICYPREQQFPIPPCISVRSAISDFTADYWGGYEYTWDALGEIKNAIQWRPGSTRHVFLFTDEPGQGAYFNERSAAARLAATGIHVHVWAVAEYDFSDVVEATEGSSHYLEGPGADPCVTQ